MWSARDDGTGRRDGTSGRGQYGSGIRQDSARPLASGAVRRHPRPVISFWYTADGVRRTARVLGSAGVALATTGVALDSLWLLGLAAWILMTAIGIELLR